jgi:hypothetical protein
MGQALVIGSPGILKNACLGLARRGFSLALIARDKPKLEELAAECFLVGRGQPRVFEADPRNGPQLDKVLREAAPRAADFDLAVCWLPTLAAKALDLVAHHLADKGAPPRLVHVVGSVAENPSQEKFARRDLEALGIRYRRVVMGYTIEEGKARWLADEEVCAGILETIDNDAPDSVIGQVEPWEGHP